MNNDNVIVDGLNRLAKEVSYTFPKSILKATEIHPTPEKNQYSHFPNEPDWVLMIRTSDSKFDKEVYFKSKEEAEKEREKLL